MSLYEIVSMIRAIEVRKKDKAESTPMSDEEFDALKDAVRAMNLPDVKLH